MKKQNIHEKNIIISMKRVYEYRHSKQKPNNDLAASGLVSKQVIQPMQKALNSANKQEIEIIITPIHEEYIIKEIHIRFGFHTEAKKIQHDLLISDESIEEFVLESLRNGAIRLVENYEQVNRSLLSKDSQHVENLICSWSDGTLNWAILAYKLSLFCDHLNGVSVFNKRLWSKLLDLPDLSKPIKGLLAKKLKITGKIVAHDGHNMKASIFVKNIKYDFDFKNLKDANNLLKQAYCENAEVTIVLMTYPELLGLKNTKIDYVLDELPVIIANQEKFNY